MAYAKFCLPCLPCSSLQIRWLVRQSDPLTLAIRQTGMTFQVLSLSALLRQIGGNERVLTNQVAIHHAQALSAYPIRCSTTFNDLWPYHSIIASIVSIFFSDLSIIVNFTHSQSVFFLRSALLYGQASRAISTG